MDLSAMHDAVRDYVRDGVENNPTNNVERNAVRSWRRRLPEDHGEIRRLKPTARATQWLDSPES